MYVLWARIYRETLIRARATERPSPESETAHKYSIIQYTPASVCTVLLYSAVGYTAIFETQNSTTNTRARSRTEETPRGSRCRRRRGARTSRWTRRLRTSGEREECECASRSLPFLEYVLRVTRFCPRLNSVRKSASFGLRNEVFFGREKVSEVFLNKKV